MVILLYKQHLRLYWTLHSWAGSHHQSSPCLTLLQSVMSPGVDHTMSYISCSGLYDILKQSSEVKKSKWTWFSFWRQLNLMKESPIKMQMLLWIKSHLRIFQSNHISISFGGSLVIEIWKLFINRFKARRIILSIRTNQESFNEQLKRI